MDSVDYYLSFVEQHFEGVLIKPFLFRMKPQLPLIAIIKNALSLVTDDDSLRKVNARWLLTCKASGTKFFDGNNKVWEGQAYSQKFKPTLLNRVLAQTFYNPMMEVSWTWNETGTYTVEELKEQLRYCIDQDDDIITQWVDADSLKAKLEECRQFLDVFAMLSAYVFDPDEDKIYKEFPSEE